MKNYEFFCAYFLCKKKKKKQNRMFSMLSLKLNGATNELLKMLNGPRMRDEQQ